MFMRTASDSLLFKINAQHLEQLNYIKENESYWIAGAPCARSIRPKFLEISVENSMDQFGPTGKVFKKLVHLFKVDHCSQLEFSVEWITPTCEFLLFKMKA